MPDPILYKAQKWKVMRSDTGEMEDIIIQKGTFWCLKHIHIRGEPEPETGFDKRPAVG